MFVTFDGLLGAGLGRPLVGGLGEAVGLFGFGRAVTGLGEIDFGLTDDGFGDNDNGLLGEIDFEDNVGTVGFGEAGFGDA